MTSGADEPPGIKKKSVCIEPGTSYFHFPSTVRRHARRVEIPPRGRSNTRAN